MQYSELPPGTQIKGIFAHGASYWTRTAEIETEQSDGSQMSFFVKVGYAQLTFTIIRLRLLTVKYIGKRR
jgi:hypothetical protein